VRVENARVLELFAGSGALSLECLSRGAASVLCIEKSPRHAEFIRTNAAAAGFGEILETRVQDVFPMMHQLAESGRQFDLILADPPYGEKNVNRRSLSFAQQLLDDKNLPKLLAAGGRFVLGHTKRDTLEIVPPWHFLADGQLEVLQALVKRGGDGQRRNLFNLLLELLQIFLGAASSILLATTRRGFFSSAGSYSSSSLSSCL
jgi:16S rRNA G966 N2-methylase RsmD